MSGENVEATLARFDERIRTIINEAGEAKENDRRIYEKLDEVGRVLTSMQQQLRALESNFATAKPTIDEFVVLKHKLLGAGALGKWVWIATGALISLLYSSRTQIIEWMTNK